MALDMKENPVTLTSTNVQRNSLVKMERVLIRWAITNADVRRDSAAKIVNGWTRVKCTTPANCVKMEEDVCLGAMRSRFSSANVRMIGPDSIAKKR